MIYCVFPLLYIQVMIYLIDKVLPESYFANNLRALSGKHNDTHTRWFINIHKTEDNPEKDETKQTAHTITTSAQNETTSSIILYKQSTEFVVYFQ